MEGQTEREREGETEGENEGGGRGRVDSRGRERGASNKSSKLKEVEEEGTSSSFPFSPTNTNTNINITSTSTSTSAAAMAGVYIKDIKVALDYDDLMQLQQDGYELTCELLTKDGIQREVEQLWKFHIVALYSSTAMDEEEKHSSERGSERGSDRGGGGERGRAGERSGVEDVLWLKTPKSVGTLPTLKGYTIYHDADLTELEGDVSAV